ncbi:MAG: hypothetical protein IPK67_14395 [Planctomycetes bacterium]|nr:hypothetical protein [Planctomycetota bacterium]
MLVAESLSRRVVVLGPKGERLREFGVGLLRDPRDVALAGGGRIAVSDAGADAVFVFDGRQARPGVRGQRRGARPAARPGGHRRGGRAARGGRLGQRPREVFASTAPWRRFGSRGPARSNETARRTWLSRADARSAWPTSSTSACGVFSAAGELLLGFGTPGPNPGQFGGPTGLAVHGTFVHVVDRDNSRVQIFDAAGELVDWYGIRALPAAGGPGQAALSPAARSRPTAGAP